VGRLRIARGLGTLFDARFSTEEQTEAEADCDVFVLVDKALLVLDVFAGGADLATGCCFA